MRSYVRLIRAGNVAVSFAGVAIAGLAAKGAGFPLAEASLLPIGLAALSTAFVTAGGNVLNDLGDLESDRINHPDRPLVTGAISVRNARILAISLLVLSAAVVAPIVPSAPLLAPIWGAAILALLSYEFRYKARGLAGNGLVAFLTGAVFLYGGAAGGNALIVVPFALMAFAATFSRELIKDMEDAAGDIDRRTFPRERGMGSATLAARGFVGAAIALSPVPLVTFVRAGSAAGLLYGGLVLVADALFVVSVLWLPARLHREQSLSKGAMTVALLAFLGAAFR